MPSLRELRENAKTQKELLDRRAERIRAAVLETMDSPGFAATAAEHRTEDVQKLADKITTRVTEVVNDAVSEFLDACTARGLKKSEIRRAVNIVNEAFGLTESNVYDEKLKAVAEYMKMYPNMYDQFAPLNG